MTAVETIERLIRLGTVVRSAASEFKSEDASFKWETFLASNSFGEISKTVQSLLASLTQTDIDKTIDRLAQKQTALLGGGKPEDLPVEKLIQFAQLSDAKILLRAKKVALAANPSFLAWLTEEALPVLLKVAPTVLPLIL